MDDEVVTAPSKIQELKALHENPDYIWMLREIDMDKLSKNEKPDLFFTHGALEYISRHSRR